MIFLVFISIFFIYFLQIWRFFEWERNGFNISLHYITWFSTMTNMHSSWKRSVSWWRHQIEIFSVLLALCGGIRQSPVNSPHKGQWHEALMFSLICAWTNVWANNRDAGDLKRHCTHYDVTVIRRARAYIHTILIWTNHRWIITSIFTVRCNQSCLFNTECALAKPQHNLSKVD